MNRFAGLLTIAVFVLAPLSTGAAQALSPDASGQPPLAGRLAAEPSWTLEEAVAAALAHHPVVEAARARVEAARGGRAAAAALPNPVGTFWFENAAYPGQRKPADLASETSLYFSYPLESLFHRGPLVRRADEDVNAALAGVALARRTVALETAQAFFAVALAQALLDEAVENRERVEQLVAYNRARVDAGVTAEGELLRLQVELDRAASDVVFAEVEVTRQRGRLAPYTPAGEGGVQMATVRTDVPSSPIAGSAMLPALDSALAAARARRPEMALGRARAEAANAAIAYERALAVRQTGATFGNKRSAGASSMIAGLSVTIPLFNVNGGAIARASHDRLAAEEELAWADRLVAADVQAAHASAARLSDHVNELRETVLARADEVHRLTLAAYQEGGATLLQVLDATRMLADARLTYSRTLFAERETLFRLALAMGTEPLDAFGALRAWSTAPATGVRAGDLP